MVVGCCHIAIKRTKSSSSMFVLTEHPAQLLLILVHVLLISLSSLKFSRLKIFVDFAGQSGWRGRIDITHLANGVD